MHGGGGQNVVPKYAAPTSTNGSGQQQVFTGIKKISDHIYSLFISCYKDPGD